ncbi:hypothetical protein P8452_25246 [Trifolium repens]|nr:hypothetical protein P8452_25246 [Trifolium repens]
MHLQLGEVSTIVVSSPECASEMMKTHDIHFATRPQILATEIMTYNSTSIAFSPYGNYWRQLRKICTSELLSLKRVNSYHPIREEVLSNLVKWIASENGSPINLTEARVTGLRPKLESFHRKTDQIFENIINDHKVAKYTKGKDDQGVEEDLVDVLLKYEDASNQDFSLTKDNIKAIIMDMFGAGSETSANIIDWAMVEMLPSGITSEELDMTEEFGVTLRRKDDLLLLPFSYHPLSVK